MAEDGAGLSDTLPDQERSDPRPSRLPRLRRAERDQVELRSPSLAALVVSDQPPGPRDRSTDLWGERPGQRRCLSARDSRMFERAKPACCVPLDLPDLRSALAAATREAEPSRGP